MKRLWYLVLVSVILVVVILALVTVMAVGKVQVKVLVLVSLLVWVLLSVVSIGFVIGIGKWVRVHTRKCCMVQRGVGRENERQDSYIWLALPSDRLAKLYKLRETFICSKEGRT